MDVVYGLLSEAELELVLQVPQIEIEEQVVEVPVAKQVQVPMIQKVQKMVDVPQVEYEDQATPKGRGSGHKLMAGSKTGWDVIGLFGFLSFTETFEMGCVPS